MNPIEDIRSSRLARGLDNPEAAAIPRGLHRKECFFAVSTSVDALFQAWLRDDLDAMAPALASLIFDVLDTAAVYGIDLGEAWKGEVESR